MVAEGKVVREEVGAKKERSKARKVGGGEGGEEEGEEQQEVRGKYPAWAKKKLWRRDGRKNNTRFPY